VIRQWWIENHLSQEKSHLKSEIIITLLNKLVEEGNSLYRKHCYMEAHARYAYTLKKFPVDTKNLTIEQEAIKEMKFNLLLNSARCNRKLEEYQTSIDFCTAAIELKNDSHEAFYSRARAKRDLKEFESALDDLEVAAQLCPTNSDIKKLKKKIKEEKSLTALIIN
jgi:tetratricopeptide (TPR) repeat protein